MSTGFQPLLPAAAELLGPVGQSDYPGPLPSIGNLLTGVAAASLQSAPAAGCSVTAALTTAIPLAASPAAVVTASATTLIVDAIGKAGSPAFIPSIGLNFLEPPLAVAVSATCTVSPTLTTSIPLAVTLAAVASVGALDITTAIRPVAAIASVASATADLTAISNKVEPQRGYDLPAAYFVDPGWSALYWPTVQGMPPNLAGSAVQSLFEAAPASVVTIAPDLQTAIPLAAAVAGTVVATASTLLIGAAFDAVAACSLTAGADLSTSISLAVSISTSCSITAELYEPGTVAQLSATPSAVCTVAPDLDVTAITMACATAGVATVNAQLAALLAFDAIVAAQVSAAAELQTEIALVAEIDCVGRVRADFDYGVLPKHDSKHRIGRRQEDDRLERVGPRIGRRRIG